MNTLKFTHTGSAYYASAALNQAAFIDSIIIQDESNRELAIEWVVIGSQIAPMIRLFDDCWSMLFSNPELMEMFASLEKQAPSAQQVKDLLISFGVVDDTPYTPA